MVLDLIFFWDDISQQCNEINMEYLRESISDYFGFIFLTIFLSLNSGQGFNFKTGIKYYYHK